MRAGEFDRARGRIQCILASAREQVGLADVCKAQGVSRDESPGFRQLDAFFEDWNSLARTACERERIAEMKRYIRKSNGAVRECSRRQGSLERMQRLVRVSLTLSHNA